MQTDNLNKHMLLPKKNSKHDFSHRTPPPPQNISVAIPKDANVYEILTWKNFNASSHSSSLACHENRQTMKHMFALLRRLLFGMSFARYFYLKCQSVSQSLKFVPWSFLFSIQLSVCLSVRVSHFCKNVSISPWECACVSIKNLNTPRNMLQNTQT